MGDNQVILPSRKWSIVALGSLGVATVLLSYVLAFLLALACLLLPVLLFVIFPLENANLFAARLLLSVFGIAAGLTILWSLMPRRNKLDVNGVLIDLTREKRIATEIETIATALDEPMPVEVYLIGDANAFVAETGGFLGLGRRRIIALGLPLLQMLTIAQFRAVLAHEFAHYYAGDTRLGPWVYSARTAILRVYENLGRKSDVIRFLTRWIVVAIPYMGLMAAMRAYWNVFMRITQWISRRQEYRCDELACYIAGSQSLVEGLQWIRRCGAALNAYWNSEVLPVAVAGFQPPLADGFRRFLEAPAVAKAAAEYLEKLDNEESSPLDTHPPMYLRIERARRSNLPAPSISGPLLSLGSPMVSLFYDVASLEADLLKRLVPSSTETKFKLLAWDSVGTEVYVPMWRTKIESYAEALSKRKLEEFPLLLRERHRFPDFVRHLPVSLNSDQSDREVSQVLFCALSLCLLDHGWTLVCPPGILYLKRGEERLDPGEIISDIRTGKLAPLEWHSLCAERQLIDLPLAARSAPQPVN